jgi:hypothetical protein
VRQFPRNAEVQKSGRVASAEPFAGERFRLTPPKPIPAKTTEVTIVRSSKLSGAWCWGSGDRWRAFGSPFATPHAVSDRRSHWEGRDLRSATRGFGSLRTNSST